jgi:[lysine-biosynthesis-protein LysW]--L-2-aminoadipate ligase
VLAVDVIEHPERGFLINEINHTMEFHTTQPLSGIDIGGMIVDYVTQVAKGQVSQSTPLSAVEGHTDGCGA